MCLKFVQANNYHHRHRGNENVVYDSLYPSVGTSTQREMTALMFCNEKEICAKIIAVQLQSGMCE